MAIKIEAAQRLEASDAKLKSMLAEIFPKEKITDVAGEYVVVSVKMDHAVILSSLKKHGWKPIRNEGNSQDFTNPAHKGLLIELQNDPDVEGNFYISLGEGE